MNAFIRRACARRGFSVVEVLVTIAIITILMALFVPALNKVGEVAARVKQKAQFTNIELGLEAYKNDYGDYPISFSYDGLAFCDGAQTLGEAIVGLDGLGLHPDSIFSPGRLDAAGVEIYYPGIAGTPQETASVQSRTGPYLENDAANAIRLGDIYDNSPASLAGTMVLADMFTKKMRTGIKAGMPILYYKANPANKTIDPTLVSEQDMLTYRAYDNDVLLHLKIKDTRPEHPLGVRIENLY
ncbi:hypothetical protein LCGC14_2187910, partial [marine sediment metagenome]